MTSVGWNSWVCTRSDMSKKNWNFKKWTVTGRISTEESWQLLLCHPHGKCVSTQVICEFWVDQIYDCLLRQTTTSETKRSKYLLLTSNYEISCVDIGGLTVSPSVSWYATDVVGSIRCEILSRFLLVACLLVPPGKFTFEVIYIATGYLRSIP